MAKNKSDVELVISAENKAQATLEDFNKLVDQINKTQKEMAGQMDKTGDSADDLKKSIAQLNIANTQLAARGKTISSYREQAAAMGKVSIEFLKQRDALKQTEAAMNQMGPPTKDLLQTHKSQSVQVNKLKREYDRLAKHMKKTRASMSEQKISVRNLVKEEKELAQSQRNVAGAIAQQTAALEKVAGASSRAGKGLAKMGRDSRKSLSFFQRLRGEALAMTAAFGGLYAAGRGVKAVFDISRKIAASKARLSVAFEGDNGKVAEELARVRKEADRLGVNFETLVDEYTKFIPSAKRTGLTLEESRHIFDAITESAVVNRASMEDLGGIYKAVTQIISKGQVQAEELRGQLGDRLVGAVIDYANALGVSTAELNKMLEQGEVTSSSLIEFATELKSVYGDELANAVQQPVSQLARMQNAITDIKIELAESGFVDELGTAMAVVAEELKSPATQEGARSLGKALGEVVKVLVKIIQNFDKVILIAKAFISLRIAHKIVSIGTAAAVGAKGVAAFATAMSVAGKRALFLAGPVGILAGIVFLLIDIGLAATGATDKLGKFGKKIDELQKSNSDNKLEELKSLIEEADSSIAFLEAEISRVSKLVPEGGDFALNKHIGKMEAELADYKAGRIAAEKEFEKLDAIRKKLAGEDDEDGVEGRFVAKLSANTRKTYKSLTDQFVKINEKAAKVEAKTIQERLAAIDLSYQDMYAKIDMVEAKLRERLAQLVEVRDDRTLSDQVRSLVVADIANMQEMLNQLDEGRGTLGNGVLQERQAAIELYNKKRITEELKISDFITATQKEAAAQQGATLEQRLRFIDQQLDERIAKIKLLETASPEVKEGGIDAIEGLREELKQRAELVILQEQINELLELQSEQVEIVKLSYNDIWEKQAEIAEINETINPQVEAMAVNALAAAKALGDERAVSNMKLVLAQVQRMNKELGLGVVAIHRMFAQGLTRAISDTVSGVKSAGEAFKQFAGDFLKRLAEMIIQQQIFNALQAAANSTGYGGVANFLGAATQHSGGISGASSNPIRNVPAYAFAGAPRLHAGGIPGIKANEVPTILERGEEVLTTDDARHAANGGGAAPVTIMNSFDTESVVSQGIATPAGERAILNVIKANRNALKGI